MLVLATTLTQAANDKQQLAPMVEVLAGLPADIGLQIEVVSV